MPTPDIVHRVPGPESTMIQQQQQQQSPAIWHWYGTCLNRYLRITYLAPRTNFFARFRYYNKCFRYVTVWVDSRLHQVLFSSSFAMV